MNLNSSARARACSMLVALIAAAGFAGAACADSVGGPRVIKVKSTDTVIIEDGDRVIYIASPRSRTGSGGASRADMKKQVSYEGIGTEEAIRRHNEVVGQLMDNPSRPVECR